MKKIKWQYRLLRYLGLIDEEEIKELCLEEKYKTKLVRKKGDNCDIFCITQNEKKYCIIINKVISLLNIKPSKVKKEIMKLIKSDEQLCPEQIVMRLYHQLKTENKYLIIPDIEITETEDGVEIYDIKGIIIQ